MRNLSNRFVSMLTTWPYPLLQNRKNHRFLPFSALLVKLLNFD